MIRSSALAFIGAMAVATPQIHVPIFQSPVSAQAYTGPAETDVEDSTTERLVVYYSPLAATEISKYVGLGVAYHMAIVYTDASGRSYGASARPSNLRNALSPGNAFNAILYMANERPSSFGTLIADPRNNTVFIKGSAGDFYTKDGQGREYPHTQVLRGKNLSHQWGSIVRTYDNVSRLGLSYSPVNQNSNSLAATALRRANIDLDFSSHTYFVPGAFTVLPSSLPVGG
jgi:hypothetical protein